MRPSVAAPAPEDARPAPLRAGRFCHCDDEHGLDIGQFVHLMRRNVPMIFIVENNGCDGLTKGQLSPTADAGSTLKNGVVSDLPAIDLRAIAIELGASFVARSFSGDKKQLQSLLKAAIAHRGTVMLDVLSPCVAFNDHEGSTKSYSYVKDHDEPLASLPLERVRPPRAALSEIMEGLK